MSGSADTLVRLREQLRESFPEAHASSRVPPAGSVTLADKREAHADDEVDESGRDVGIFQTGVAPLDHVGIPPGAITELVGRHASGGTALLTHALLQATAGRGKHLALIDSRDRFDPAGADLAACDALLWLRCEDVEASLKAADLLLRDGNLSLVLADFQLESPRALRAVPISSWHRLRALAEKTGVTLLVFTPAPLIPTAHLRLELEARFSLDALNQPRESLLESFPLTVTRRLGQGRQLAAAS